MLHRIDFMMVASMTKSVLSIALSHFGPLTPISAFHPCTRGKTPVLSFIAAWLFFFFNYSPSFGSVLMNNLKLFQHFFLLSLTLYKNINDAWKRTWQKYIWDSGKCFWNWLTFFLSKIKKKSFTFHVLLEVFICQSTL